MTEPQKTVVDHHLTAAEWVLHELRTRVEVPNTFGMTYQLANSLEALLHGPGPAGDREKARLAALVEAVRGNRLLFSIPETWLVEKVMRAAAALVRREQGRDGGIGA